MINRKQGDGEEHRHSACLAVRHCFILIQPMRIQCFKTAAPDWLMVRLPESPVTVEMGQDDPEHREHVTRAFGFIARLGKT